MKLFQMGRTLVKLLEVSHLQGRSRAELVDLHGEGAPDYLDREVLADAPQHLASPDPILVLGPALLHEVKRLLQHTDRANICGSWQCGEAHIRPLQIFTQSLQRPLTCGSLFPNFPIKRAATAQVLGDVDDRGLANHVHTGHSRDRRCPCHCGRYGSWSLGLDGSVALSLRKPLFCSILLLCSCDGPVTFLTKQQASTGCLVQAEVASHLEAFPGTNCWIQWDTVHLLGNGV
mmetsp:Transcript_94479/g.170642  ORF Transcript_94479/g.170642 Transcript_94479/m.170642 type:complete len:232 (-) Transcript_94479:613-1308(-)